MSFIFCLCCSLSPVNITFVLSVLLKITDSMNGVCPILWKKNCDQFWFNIRANYRLFKYNVSLLLQGKEEKKDRTKNKTLRINGRFLLYHVSRRASKKEVRLKKTIDHFRVHEFESIRFCFFFKAFFFSFLFFSRSIYCSLQRSFFTMVVKVFF